MIRQKDLEKHRFFTTNGKDMWRVVGVVTVTEVQVVNCENNAKGICRLGEPMTKEIGKYSLFVSNDFHAVNMPHITAHFDKDKKETKPQAIKPKTTKKKQRKSSSQYKGVCVRKSRKGLVRYFAQRTVKGKNINLGLHESEELAAAAVQEHLGNVAEASRLRMSAGKKESEEVDKKSFFPQDNSAGDEF